jgi:hypothetical protein
LSDLPIAEDTAGRHLAAVRAATGHVGVPAHAAAHAAGQGEGTAGGGEPC